MNKLTYSLALLVVLVGASACSRLQPVKEVVTVPTVVETPEIDAPTIRIVPRPDPIEMRNADIVVVTEANLQEVIERIKTEQGDFVLYGDSFYAIVQLKEAKELFGQVDRRIEISAQCLRAREGLFDGT